MGLIEDLSSAIEGGVDTAIDVNTLFFGIPARIFYPKEFEHYSGRYDDIKYLDVPDLEMEALVPGYYSANGSPINGRNDFLLQDTLTWYVKGNLFIPALSKVELVSDKFGVSVFKVSPDSPCYKTKETSLCNKYELTPFLGIPTNSELKDDLVTISEDHLSLKSDLDFEDDTSIKVEKSGTAPKFQYKPVT